MYLLLDLITDVYYDILEDLEQRNEKLNYDVIRNNKEDAL
jgi:Mg2+ and Co2+ transporter CorA